MDLTITREKIEAAREAGAPEAALAEAEKLIGDECRNPKWLYWYAMNVLHRPWPEAEQVFRRAPKAMKRYLNNILRWGAVQGRLDDVKYAVERGADIVFGDTPTSDCLMLVFHQRRAEEFFKKYKVSVWPGGRLSEPFLFAVEFGHAEIVKYLVENGAHIFIDKDYLIQLAEYGGHKAIAQYLQGATWLPRPDGWYLSGMN